MAYRALDTPPRPFTTKLAFGATTWKLALTSLINSPYVAHALSLSKRNASVTKSHATPFARKVISFRLANFALRDLMLQYGG